MSHLNIYLFVLALGLWLSIYLYRFREKIKEWYLNKFDNTSPSLPPDGKIPEVSLPFNYSPPAPKDESSAEEGETPAAGDASSEPREMTHNSAPSSDKTVASPGTGVAG